MEVQRQQKAENNRMKKKNFQATQEHDSTNITPKPRFNVVRNHFIQWLLVIFLGLGAWSFLTIRIYKSTLDRDLPSNEQCLKISTALPKYYEAQIGVLFGKELPEGSLDKAGIEALVKDCEINRGLVTIKVGG